MRKIIQLIVDSNNYIIALCDDGTLWVNDSSHTGWSLLPTVEIYGNTK